MLSEYINIFWLFIVNCVPSIKKKDDIVDEKYRVKQKKDRIISDSMVNFDQKLKKVSGLI